MRGDIRPGLVDAGSLDAGSKREVDLNLTRPDGSHAGWTVIAGRNGSGKTSLLRAIALAVSRPAVARSLVPDFEDWITIGRPEASAEVRLSYDAGVDRWSGAGRTPDTAFLASLKWAIEANHADEPERRGVQPALKSTACTAATTRAPTLIITSRSRTTRCVPLTG